MWISERSKDLPRQARLAITGAVLIVSVFVAGRFGLVALIAHGYRALAWVFLALYVLPLMTMECSVCRGGGALRRRP